MKRKIFNLHLAFNNKNKLQFLLVPLEPRNGQRHLISSTCNWCNRPGSKRIYIQRHFMRLDLKINFEKKTCIIFINLIRKPLQSKIT